MTGRVQTDVRHNTPTAREMTLTVHALKDNETHRPPFGGLATTTRTGGSFVITRCKDKKRMQTTLIIANLVGAILFCFALYMIIYNASYGRKLWRESVKQRDLLVEIAKRLDTPDEVIDEILDDVEEVKAVE